MKLDDLSDNAFRLWFAYFLTPRNTLRFGGRGSTMQITPECRKALDELIEAKAVVPVDPDDSVPEREHYGATEVDLRQIALERGGGDYKQAYAWLTDRSFVMFKAEGA